jgi:lipoprotein-anchoring transpeptidase ErfK/SrfK
MKTLTAAAAVVIFGFIAIQPPEALAAAGAAHRFFDPASKSWVEFGPGGSGSRSTRNPVPRETVAYDGPQGANTIVIDTSERRLYFVQGDGTAIRYGVGVGREGFQWAGVNRITRKAEWPGWTPPPAMRKRQPNLPDYMEGGPGNPLGARAMYIGSTLYRIHGSNEPWTIGQAVSSGCIRMVNEDVMHLYERVSVGTRSSCRTEARGRGPAVGTKNPAGSGGVLRFSQ